MDGTAIYQGAAVVFIAILASIGTAGVPGAGIILLAMVLNAIGFPLEGIALIAGIERVLDMLRTSVNIVGDVVGAGLVAGIENEITYSSRNR